MLRSYLLTLYRSLTRHQLFALLNIFGLAVGMAVFLTLSIAVRFENSYDRWIPNAERTHRVSLVFMPSGRTPEPFALAPGPVLPNLQAEFRQIEAGVRLLTGTMPVRRGEQGDYEELVFADSTFFDVFDLPLAAGSKAQAIADNSRIVVSETMARKYFGRTNVVGERITVMTEGTPRDYRVSAVLKDLPENTHLKIDFIARLDEAVLPERAEYLDVWNATNYATYIRLPDEASAQQLQAALPGFLARRGGSDIDEWMDLKLESVPDIHFNPATLASMKPGVDRRYVTMLQVIGILTLLLAVINYVNLSTARAVLRAREVALRKVFGATRGALVAQFLLEAVLLSVAAGLIAVALVELSLPLVNAALGQPLELSYFGDDGVLPVFLAIVVAVGVAAGFYPALVISRYEPAGVLASARAPGGGRMAGLVREVLVVAQFGVSIALLICTAVVFAQADFVRRADVGFQREQVIVVKEVGSKEVWPRARALQEAIRRVPGVESVTVAGRYPGWGGVGSSSSFVREGLKGEPPTLSLEVIGDQYLETYGMRLAAGRKLGTAQRLDDASGPGSEEAMDQTGLNIMINESAARALEFQRPQEALGKIVRQQGGAAPLRVVGVVRDAAFGSPREKVPPIFYVKDSTGVLGTMGNPTLGVRFRGDPKSMMPRLEATWRRVVPDVPFEGETVQAALNTFYEPEEQRGRLVTLGAIVACVLGCLGLYGLAAFTSERRTKEIGIRKVLGASTADVFRLLVGQFLRPVIIANLIAWPVAFLLMREWLNGFEQRIELNPAYFLAATALALLVALLTVTGQALRVARCDPGQALHYE